MIRVRIIILALAASMGTPANYTLASSSAYRSDLERQLDIDEAKMKMFLERAKTHLSPQADLSLTTDHLRSLLETRLPCTSEVAKALSCVRQYNDQFLQNHIDRIQTEISELEEQKNLFRTNGRLHRLPFYAWKPAELDEKIYMKEQALRRLQTYQLLWAQTSGLTAIRQTGLFLNMEQVKSFAAIESVEKNSRDAFDSFHSSKMGKLKGRYDSGRARKSKLSYRDQRELANRMKNGLTDTKVVPGSQSEREFDVVVKFIKENMPHATQSAVAKGLDKHTSSEIQINGQYDPYLIANHPRIMKALLQNSDRVQQLLSSDQDFNKAMNLQLQLTDTALDNAEVGTIVNRPLATYFFNEVSEKIGNNPPRPQSLEDAEIDHINRRAEKYLEMANSRIEAASGISACGTMSTDVLSTEDQELASESQFTDANFFILPTTDMNQMTKTSPRRSLETRIKLAKLNMESTLEQHKFDMDFYHQYSRAEPLNDHNDNYVLGAIKAKSPVHLDDFLKSHPELAPFTDAESNIDLNFLQHSPPSLQGQSNSCVAHTLVADLEEAEILEDGTIRKQPRFSTATTYGALSGFQYLGTLTPEQAANFKTTVENKLQKEGKSLKDIDKGVFTNTSLALLSKLPVQVETANNAQFQMVLQDSLLEYQTDSVFIKNMSESRPLLAEGQVYPPPTVDFYKQSLQRGEGLAITISTDTHIETEDVITLKPGSGNIEHVFYLNGYVEKSVDPYDGVEKPMFILRDSFVESAATYRISAAQMIRYQTGMFKITETQSVQEAQKKAK